MEIVLDSRIEKRKIELLGAEFTNNTGDKCFVIDYINAFKVLVVFYDTLTTDYFSYNSLKLGGFVDYNKPNVVGVGYLGERRLRKSNNLYRKSYEAWSHILNRCYNEKTQEKNPQYKYCTVDPVWHSFKNFREWYLNQPELLNTEEDTGNRWSIDKDILVKGNRVYSPDTCCVVPNEINTLMVKPQQRKVHTDLPEGVGYIKPRVPNAKKGYSARLNCGTGEKDRYLGYYDTPEEAFLVYKEAKEKRIKEVANKWKGKIADDVYESLINWKVGD